MKWLIGCIFIWLFYKANAIQDDRYIAARSSLIEIFLGPGTSRSNKERNIPKLIDFHRRYPTEVALTDEEKTLLENYITDYEAYHNTLVDGLPPQGGFYGLLLNMRMGDILRIYVEHLFDQSQANITTTTERTPVNTSATTTTEVPPPSKDSPLLLCQSTPDATDTQYSSDRRYILDLFHAPLQSMTNWEAAIPQLIKFYLRYPNGVPLTNDMRSLFEQFIREYQDYSNTCVNVSTQPEEFCGASLESKFGSIITMYTWQLSVQAGLPARVHMSCQTISASQVPPRSVGTRKTQLTCQPAMGMPAGNFYCYYSYAN